tara:strand:- start:1333 stop:1536 length:204 start_codon:yes stop_codon:yes gene_type:complete
MKIELYKYDFKVFEDNKSAFDDLLLNLNINNNNLLNSSHIINDYEINNIENIESIEIDCITEIITIN